MLARCVGCLYPHAWLVSDDIRGRCSARPAMLLLRVPTLEFLPCNWKARPRWLFLSLISPKYMHKSARACISPETAASRMPHTRGSPSHFTVLHTATNLARSVSTWTLLRYAGNDTSGLDNVGIECFSSVGSLKFKPGFLKIKPGSLKLKPDSLKLKKGSLNSSLAL